MNETPCQCGAVIDDLTWIVHREVHGTPLKIPLGSGLQTLPFALMPDIARIIERFALELLKWIQEQTQKHEHCCITGDCAHESQLECWQKLVEDCASDLRAKL